MSVTVTCEACGQTQQVTSGPGGDTVECSACGHLMAVPAAAAGPSDGDPQGGATAGPAPGRLRGPVRIVLMGVVALAAGVAFVILFNARPQEDAPQPTTGPPGRQQASPAPSLARAPGPQSASPAPAQQPGLPTVGAPPGWSVWTVRAGLADSASGDSGVTTTPAKPEYEKWLRVGIQTELGKSSRKGWRLAAADCLLVNADDPTDTHRCLGIVDAGVKRKGGRGHIQVPMPSMEDRQVFCRLQGSGAGGGLLMSYLCSALDLDPLSAGDSVSLYVCFPEEAARPDGRYVLQIAR